MKKFLCFLLVAVVLLSCCGCQKQDPTGTTVDFYYRAKEPVYGSGNGIFFIEVREISYEATDYQKLIEEYLRGARIDACYSPFPPGTSLVKLSVGLSGISVELSPHMAFQSNADMIVCCACLSKTLFSVSDIRTVTFSIENRDINGQSSITFDRESFVNWDIHS